MMLAPAISSIAATLAPFTPAISAVSGVIGVVSAYQSAQANKQALNDEAAQADENARRVLQAGQTQAQDQDLANFYSLQEQANAQAGSGLSVNSASAVRTRRMNRTLARRDTMRIVQDSQVQAESLSNSAASSRSAAGQISPFMSALTTGIGAATSLISSADKINPKTRQRISGAKG